MISIDIHRQRFSKNWRKSFGLRQFVSKNCGKDSKVPKICAKQFILPFVLSIKSKASMSLNIGFSLVPWLLSKGLITPSITRAAKFYIYQPVTT